MIQKESHTQEETKIDYNPYPSIKPLISKILKSKGQTKLKNIYLEVKFAKLKQNVSEQYQQFREDSKNQIVLLSSKPNFKQYNFKAGASEQQYNIVLKNLLKHTPPQKQIKSKSLKIILSQQERLTRIFQNKNQRLWTFDQKKQQFARQFKIIQNKKQFRINFCTLTQSKQLEDKINKEINGQIKSLIQHVRFVQNQFYTISQFYKMVLTKVYQPKLTQQFTKEIQTAYKQYNSQKLDQYILEQICENKYPLHFEIEARLTEIGEKIMRKLIDKPVKLNRFVGDMIKNTRNLVDQEFKEIVQGTYQRQQLDIFMQEYSDFEF